MTGNPPERLVLAACVVDLAGGAVHRDGETTTLTALERRLLAYMAQRPHEVLHRDTLLGDVWGYDPPPATRAVDVVIQRLRHKIESDSAHPAHLVTVHAEGYQFVPPERFGTARTNLAADPTSFLGRAEELADLERLLAGGARLVTLLGPPGAGKTRLARELGRASLAAWAGGTWFCDLTGARDATGVRDAVARVLSVSLPVEADAETAVADAIAALGPALLVLDNFEQVVDAAPATVSRWLGRAADARLVVTSRERLNVPGEHVVRLDSLPRADAVALFLDRARAVRRAFAADPSELPAVDEIVDRLDRLPLALELAAGRAGLLDAHALRDRLRQTLDLVAGGRGRSDRQASLAGAVAWSWQLLDDAERHALALCSAFEGPFTLEAAEAVLARDDGVSLLQALQDRCLVAVRPAGGEVRLALYESVRDLAFHKLEELGLVAQARAAHARWYVQRGEGLLRAFERDGRREVLAGLRADVPNLEAVFARFEHRDPALAVRAALLVAQAVASDAPRGALGLLDRALELAGGEGAIDVLCARATLLRVCGYLADGLRDAEHAAAAATDDVLAARAHAVLADTLVELGRFDQARRAAERALALDGDRVPAGLAHRRLALIHMQQNRLDEARAHVRAALDQFGGWDGSPSRRAALHAVAGMIEHAAGNLEDARAHHEHALTLARSLGQRRFAASHLGNLGNVHADRGDLGRAEACHQESLAMVQALGLRRTEANTWGNLALLALARGDLAEARQRAERGLAASRELGAYLPQSGALMALGITALAEGDRVEAVSRLEAAWAAVGERSRSEFTPLVGAWLGIALRAAGKPDAGHLSAARASGLPDAVAVCDVFEGRDTGATTLFVRIARGVLAA